MNQSSVIGGALIFAYVIFEIYRGKLPCWFNMLGIPTSAQCSIQLPQSACTGGTAQQTTSGNTAPQGTGGTNVSVNLGGSNPFCVGQVHVGQLCTGSGSGGGGGGIGIGGIGIGIGIGGGGIGLG